MKKIISLLILLNFVASCASFKPEVIKQRKTFYVTNSTPQALNIISYGSNVGSQFGLLGSVLSEPSRKNAADSANSIAQIMKVRISDKIKDELSKTLKNEYNLIFISKNKSSYPIKNTKEELLAHYDEGDLLLDATASIMGVYYPFRFNDYQLIYTINTEIIDRKTKSIVFRSGCGYKEGKETNDNTLNELINNPKIVNDMTNRAIEHCAKEFIGKLLSKTSIKSESDTAISQ